MTGDQGFGYARAKPEGGTDEDGRTSDGIGPGEPILTPAGMPMRDAVRLRDAVAEAALIAVLEFKVDGRLVRLTPAIGQMSRATWDYLQAMRLNEAAES